MEQVKDAAAAHAEIERLAKEKAVPEIRWIESIEIGKVVRQGDIYIHRVADTHARGRAQKSRQLAIGKTMGSRHIAAAPSKVFEGVTPPTWCVPRTFLGPVLTSDQRFTIEHPEHAHVSLPAGTYQVTHQMDARTLQRVQD